MRPSTGSSCAVNETRPEYHLHDDFSLTPAYVLGYAFHALGQVDGNTPSHGRRGAVALLTELLGDNDRAGTGREPGGGRTAPHRDGVALPDPAFTTDWCHIRGAPSRRAQDSRRSSALGTARARGRSSGRFATGIAEPAGPPGPGGTGAVPGARFARISSRPVAHWTRTCTPLPPFTPVAYGGASPPRRRPPWRTRALDPDLHCTRADAAGLLAAIRVRLEGLS